MIPDDEIAKGLSEARDWDGPSTAPVLVEHLQASRGSCHGSDVDSAAASIESDTERPGVDGAGPGRGVVTSIEGVESPRDNTSDVKT